MDGNANADCEFSLTGVNITPLSNEQGTLKVVKRNNNNVLMWSAVASFGQEEFILQRSKDGQNWDNIFFAPAKNTSDVVNYNYTDSNYGSGTTYYRVMGEFNGQLKQVTKTVAIGGKSNGVVYRVVSYDIFGRVVVDDAKGLVITVTEYEDGTIETRKEFR
jgi:hypothetical protein